jgi:hypothetical protein
MAGQKREAKRLCTGDTDRDSDRERVFSQRMEEGALRKVSGA